MQPYPINEIEDVVLVFDTTDEVPDWRDATERCISYEHASHNFADDLWLSQFCEKQTKDMRKSNQQETKKDNVRLIGVFHALRSS
jgi:hypothetical protein